MILYIKKNSLLLYAFFQLFIFTISCIIIGPLIPIISIDLNIGLDYIGTAISLSIFALFFSSVVIGNFIELIGLRRVILIGLGINFVGSFLMFFSKSFILFTIALLFIEFSYGIVYICNLSIVGFFYNSKKASNLIKINLGNVSALIFAPLFVSFVLFFGINWRYYYMFNVLLIVALFFLLMNIKIDYKVDKVINIKKLLFDNLNVITNSAFLICSIIIFLYEPIMSTFYTWFTSYFNSISKDINIGLLFLTIYSIALFIGMLLKNYLIKYFNEKRILLYSFIVSLFFLLGILCFSNIFIKIVLIFLFGISIVGNFTISFSIATDFLPKYTNAASGVFFAFSNFGLIIFQYISGLFSEYYSKRSVLYINIILIFILIVMTSFLNYNRRFKRN